MTVELEEGRRGVSTQELRVVFDGSSRKTQAMRNGTFVSCVVQKAVGEVLVFDGESSVITTVDRQQGYYSFDPRVLGITTHYSWSATVESSLPYLNAKRVEFLGREELSDGLYAEHVQLIDQYDQQIDVWIDAASGFRVLQYSFSSASGASRRTTTSKYQGTERLPREIRTEEFNASGSLVGWRKIVVQEMDWDRHPSPETWTLASLDMPIGTAVSDLRIKKRIGYWTGNGLSPDPPPPGFVPQAAAKTKGNWFWLVVVNVLIVAAFAGVALRRYLTSARKSTA
jgi:hypothetical protein